MTCDVCGGKGWIRTLIDSFPDACYFCRGKGSISIRELGRKIDEDPDTLVRTQEGRSREKTVLRVLGKVQDLLQAALP